MTTRPLSRPITPGRLVSLLGPPLLVMAGIFYLSSQTSTADHSTFEVILRKIGHVTEYLVLALCWIRAMRGLGVGSNLRGAVVAGIAATFAYAVTDEIHQTFVDGRHGTPVDVLIDSIGLAIAAALVLWAGPRRLGPAAKSRSLASEHRVGERLEGVREPG
jgi:VanZ family protein